MVPEREVKNVNVFQRVEQKYVLTEEEYKKLFPRIKKNLVKDIYFRSTICNLYLDNEKNEMIIRSLEKPMFKEKVRIRSYNVPSIDDKVYLELKGKFKGVVFKRRVKVRLKDLYQYLEDGTIPQNNNQQIMREIDYVIHKQELKPKIYIAYDRESYLDKDNKDFRVTFDSNLRSRRDNLKLEEGDFGSQYQEEHIYIMEIKSLASIPLWFTKTLSELKIYPKSFSKYGNIYYKQLEEEY